VSGNFAPEGCAFTIAPRPEYMSWQLSAPTVGATPNIRRVRLGLGGNIQGTVGRADPSTSFGTAWQTDDGTLVSEVEWGTSPDPTTWPASNRRSGITWLTPPRAINPNGAERMHEAYVCGLMPATTYYYRVGGGPQGSEVWSDVFPFTTTPKPGPTPVTIAISGDSRGESNDAWQILQRKLHALGVSLSLFSGDIVNLPQDQGEWEQWLDRAWKDTNSSYLTLATLLTLSAHGNHDLHTSLFSGNLVLPQDNTSASYAPYGELFYSVDVGPVHVIVADDYFVGTPSGDPSYAPVLQGWLTADLAAANANRSVVPWVIAMHHHAAYSSSLHGMDADVLLDRAFFAPLFQKAHADVVFASHDHDYERSQVLTVGADPNKPSAGSDPTQGTTYVVSGGAGADAYALGTSAWTATSWSYLQSSAIGTYVILTADLHNLKIESHQLLSDGTDPIVDTYTIAK
jgi:hypothetical protein